MYKSIRSFLLALLVSSAAGSCGSLGEEMKNMTEITKVINASSECKVNSSSVSTGTSGRTATVEIKDCDVQDAVAEADRLNQKLLATVAAYKNIDVFTFVFTKGGVKQNIEYKNGKREAD